MNFLNKTEVHVKNISQAFSSFFDTENKLKILTKDGNISIMSSDLLRFTSPLINSILNDVPYCTSSVIFMPDVCKASVDHVISVIGSGLSNNCSLSINQTQLSLHLT